MKISKEQAESSLQYLRETPPPDEPLRLVTDANSAEFSTVVERFSDNDDVRNALVADLAQELDEHTYEVPTDWVAEKLVGRLVSDRLR